MTTMITASAARIGAAEVADEVGRPGASSTLIFTPFHSTGAIASETEMPRRCSSGSWSETVLPSSTVPIRVIAPAVKSIASSSVVLPAPPWPTSRTLRMSFASYVFNAAPPRVGRSRSRRSWHLELLGSRVCPWCASNDSRRAPRITRAVLPGRGRVRASAPAGSSWRRPADGRRLRRRSAAALLLFGGHRANHGEGGPVDRMLTELFDRGWDAAVLGADRVGRTDDDARTSPSARSSALCASFLSSYVRARGAALGYSVEESHVTRGLRYALVSIGLLFDGLGWAVWAAAVVSVLAAAVRTGQVAREERA